MSLTAWQVQEAMGRAALVYELLEVEQRIRATGGSIEKLEDPGVAGLSDDDREALQEQRREELENLMRRQAEIVETLWGAGAVAGEKSWQDEVRELDREGALVAVEQILRRRPEVSPPEDVDAMNLDELHTWLVAKIGELPEEERKGWTR